MIVKKVPNPKGGGSKSGRVGGLVNYIAALEVSNGIDHSHGAKNEKCVHFETANFVSENLQTQIKEMAALATSNVKSKDPIDHWMLSWRSDEKPTVAQAREAVQIFMKHMKLQGHQVAWGLHGDTDNTHIHIAVNRISPITGKCVEINNRFGYAEAHKALAKIEHAQGWKPAEGALFEVQNGKVVAKTKAPKEQDTKPIKQSVADKELQTGEKSVLRICQEQAALIIKSAKSWAELHANLAAEGFKFERFGSGSKIHFGDVAVKASDVDRAASITALQKKLGPYQPPGEIKSNDHHQHPSRTTRTATGAIVAAQKPNTTQTRKQPSNGLRTLSECNLAHDKTSQGNKNSGVLLTDVGTDNRHAGGLRRNDRGSRGASTGTDHSPSSGRSGGLRIVDAGGSRAAGQRVPEPLKPDQPAWLEYQAIKAERSAAKAAELLTLRTQHDADKDKLFAAHKANRVELMDKDWRGNGDAKNMLSSVIAATQAAEKLALREEHKEQRDALNARYATLPQYKVWQQQPRLLAPVATMTPSIPQPERLSTTVLGLTHSQDKRGLLFLDKGQSLFIDEGRNLAIVDPEKQSTRQIAAALAVAQHKFGTVIEVTGPDEFKQRAIEAAVEHEINLRFADPAMEAQRVQMAQAKWQAAQPQRTERAPAAQPKPQQPAVQQSAVDALAADAAREAARLQAEFQREIREAAAQQQADRDELERVRNAPELGTAEAEHEQRLDEIDDHDIQRLRAEQRRAAQPAPAPEAQQPNALDEEIQQSKEVPAQPTEQNEHLQCLTDDQREAIALTAALIERAARGDLEAIEQLPEQLDELDEHVYDARPGSGPPRREYDPRAAIAAAAEKRQDEARREVNRQAVARGITHAVPYPPGTTGLFTAEHFSSFETARKKAERDLEYKRMHTQRPERGFFGGGEKQAAWDADHAQLIADVKTAAEAIEWRDAAIKTVTKSLETRDSTQIAEHAQLINDLNAKDALAQQQRVQRHTVLTAERERLNAQVKQQLPEVAAAHARGRGTGLGG